MSYNRCLVVLLCVLHPTISYAGRLYITSHGRRLIGQSPLGIEPATLLTKCLVLCGNIANCSGSNFGPSNLGNVGYACELLDADTLETGVLEHTAGWIFAGKTIKQILSFIYKRYQNDCTFWSMCLRAYSGSR